MSEMVGLCSFTGKWRTGQKLVVVDQILTCEMLCVKLLNFCESSLLTPVHGFRKRVVLHLTQVRFVLSSSVDLAMFLTTQGPQIVLIYTVAYTCAIMLKRNHKHSVTQV